MLVCLDKAKKVTQARKRMGVAKKGATRVGEQQVQGAGSMDNGHAFSVDSVGEQHDHRVESCE